MRQSQCRLQDGFNYESCVAVAVAVALVTSSSARLNRKQMSLLINSFVEPHGDNNLEHNIPDVSVPEFFASSFL